MYPRQSIPSNTLSFDETWLKIKEIVEAFLYRRGVSRVQWQDLFFYVHNYACWTDHGGEDLRFHLQEMLQKYVKGCEKNIAYSDEGRLLDAYIAEWTNFSIVYNYLPMPFHSTESSVNQPGRPETKAKSVVKTAMLKCWRDNIFAKREPSIRKAALNLVESERLGEAINGELIVGVQESYVALFEEDDNPLETYECYFECNYIDQSANFYAQRAAAVMDENGVQTYMRYAEEKLNDEKQRCQRYLHSQTVPKLMRKLVDVLVVRFQEQLYAEFRTLIVNNHLDKMKQLFRLINQTDNGVNVLLDIIHEHIKSDGIKDMLENASTIVSDAEKYVEKLLAMFERFTRVISDAFEDDPRFLTTRDKAFQEVVNDTSIFKLELVGSRPRARGSVESRCPELLANFCDMMLRKSSVAKKLSCEEIEEKLNSVLRVLKYVQNRDVFMRCHKHHLTRRLILENSADQEKEEWMVGRLREYGMPADHIGKLQKMLQDIEINKDMNSDFKRSLGSNNNKVMSDTINIKILNSGAWDRNADEKGIVTLPREIEEMIPEVDHFYREKHSGRKLQWCPHLSHATITFGTVYGQYDLDVTTFQMAVLFCWNERADEKISLASLKLATEIPEVELNKTLLSLVAFPKSKQQILLCDCQSLNAKDFTESTNFWINTEFAIIKGNKPQKHGRMNIIGRLPLTMEQLNRKEHDEIITLRELRTQEAIVKIMKTRKNMTSAQLETELVEILKSLFLPSKRLVKEQIEWLIEHSYIRRKDDQINVFEVSAIAMSRLVCAVLFGFLALASAAPSEPLFDSGAAGNGSLLVRSKRQWGCPANCYSSCSSSNQCQGYQTATMCVQGCCCPTPQQDLGTACSGKPAVAGCLNGLCGQGFFCSNSNFCCRCPNGAEADRCVNGACPAGYVCNTNDFCCPIGGGIGGAVAGACINGQCAPGFQCGAGNLCYKMVNTIGVNGQNGGFNGFGGQGVFGGK